MAETFVFFCFRLLCFNLVCFSLVCFVLFALFYLLCFGIQYYFVSINHNISFVFTIIFRLCLQ